MDYLVTGERIRKRRLEIGLTQAELAEKIDVSQPFIGQIERGERSISIDTLLNISDALNISTDYLLRKDIDANKDMLISEFISFISKRSYDEGSKAIDILKYIFNRINK